MVAAAREAVVAPPGRRRLRRHTAVEQLRRLEERIGRQLVQLRRQILALRRQKEGKSGMGGICVLERERERERETRRPRTSDSEKGGRMLPASMAAAATACLWLFLALSRKATPATTSTCAEGRCAAEQRHGPGWCEWHRSQ